VTGEIVRGKNRDFHSRNWRAQDDKRLCRDWTLHKLSLCHSEVIHIGV